ncbi:O-antigen polymerase [Leifsonia rubra CMS 76R]|nr:O-antigen polymerase [Leifsonia rubra CMS 76R]
MTAPRPPAVPFTRLAGAALWVAIIAVIVLLPEGMNRWVLPKEATLAVAVMLASLAPASGRLPRWFIVAAGIGTAVLVTAAILSADPLPQLVGRAPRYEGLVSIPVYFAATWVGARLLGPHSSRNALEVVLRAASAIAIAVATVALLESSGVRPIATSFERPGSLLGNASDQGIVGVMLFALLSFPALRTWLPARTPPVGKGKPALALPVTWQYRLLLTAGVGAAITTVLLSASRGALLAFCVVLVVLVSFEFRRIVRLGGASVKKLLRYGLITAGAAIGCAAVAVAIPLTRSRIFGASSTIDDRILMWTESVGTLAQHPFFGLGPSGYVDVIGQAHGPQWFDQVESGATLDSPHNWLLQAASAGGLVFLTLAIAIVAVVAVVGMRRWSVTVREALDSPRWAAHTLGRADLNAGALALCTGWAVGLLTHFTSASTSILGCLVVGMLIANAPVSSVGNRRRVVSMVRTVAIGVWAGWLIVAAYAEIPLQRGVNYVVVGEIAPANIEFESASALRPWDSSIASTAAQYLAFAADNRVEGAAPLTVSWAERALAETPDSVATLKAYAVGLRASGKVSEAQRVYDRLLSMRPHDSEVMLGKATTSYMAGDTPSALVWAVRASQLDADNESINGFLEFLEQSSQEG